MGISSRGKSGDLYFWVFSIGRICHWFGSWQAQASCLLLVHAADEKKILQIVAWWTNRVGYELGERAVGMSRLSTGHFIAVQNGAFLRAPFIRKIPSSWSPSLENKNKVLETEVAESTTPVLKSGCLPHRSKSKHSISYLQPLWYLKRLWRKAVVLLF